MWHERSWPPILFDEDFPVPVARALARDPRALHVVITADEVAWRGASDERQVARAVDLGAVLITPNRTERRRFRRYIEVERARRRPGGRVDPAATSVLLLPRHDTSRDAETRLLLRTTLLLEWYLTLPLPKAPTLVWNDAQQALIRGWQPVGYSADQIRMVLSQLPPT